MIFRSLRFWRGAALFLFGMVLVQTLWMTGALDSLFSQRSGSAVTASEDGFEAFESIAFAREFSEKFLTFTSYNFKSTQTAVAFLLEGEARALRLLEIDRLSEKLERREVVQRAKLVSLVQWPKEPDRFRADVMVDLEEGVGSSQVKNQFFTQIEFRIHRTERTAQNPWGFLVGDLKYNLKGEIRSQDTDSLRNATSGLLKPGAPAVLSLRPGTALLVRFPCSIENVELPKGTPVRVKLTTLDISELQMRTTVELKGEQVLRAVCRDHIFNLRLQPDSLSASMDGSAGVSATGNPADRSSDPIVVLRLLTMADAVKLSDVRAAEKSSRSVRTRTDRRIEKSIEDQLGFVVEEE